jgi:hypothetical protein
MDEGIFDSREAEFAEDNGAVGGRGGADLEAKRVGKGR